MIQQLDVIFATKDAQPGLNSRQITGVGLHGLLFKTVLAAYSSHEADWLHNHQAPKPFAMAPLYSAERQITGLRLAALNGRTAELMVHAWEQTAEKQQELALGRQQFQVAAVAVQPELSFTGLLQQARPHQWQKLWFKTPCTFRQGPGALPLPLPYNVYQRPLEVWQQYAPPSLRLPADWLEWCAQNVFVVQHNIRTVPMLVGQRRKMSGFVGQVRLEAVSQDDTYLRLWHALTHLLRHCGTGYKTTMGFGAVA